MSKHISSTNIWYITQSKNSETLHKTASVSSWLYDVIRKKDGGRWWFPSLCFSFHKSLRTSTVNIRTRPRWEKRFVQLLLSGFWLCCKLNSRNECSRTVVCRATCRLCNSLLKITVENEREKTLFFNSRLYISFYAIYMVAGMIWSKCAR